MATAELRVVNVAAGELLCRTGRAVTWWFGVVDGFLKMSSDGGDARGSGAGHEGRAAPVTYAGLPPGGWFGEGTVIKREAYRYDVRALRASVVAGLGVDAFHRLLEHSLPFNRFIIQQLNERPRPVHRRT